MPITGHEKRLRVHSRPSSDLLAAVPIKKRRFLFSRSPSPPPESPSPNTTDCGVTKSKPESSELGLPCLKSGTSPAQANIVKGEVAPDESCNLQPQALADSVMPEKKPKFSELVSPFSVNAGNHSQVNPVTGHLVSSAECCVSQKKVECPKSASPFSTTIGNPVQVGSVADGNTSIGLPLAAAECGLFERKPKSSERPESPFSNNGVNPALMKAVTSEIASREHYGLPYAAPTLGSAVEKKPEPLNMVSLFSETTCYSSRVTTAKVKYASSGSCEKPMSTDFNKCPKPEILPTFNDHVPVFNLAANYLDGSRIVQETVLDCRCAAQSVGGSVVFPSAMQGTFVASGAERYMEGKLTLGEGISVKKEVPELHKLRSASSDTTLKPVASRHCLNRSNWDLNTTMDAWGGSSAGSLLNNTAAGYARQNLGAISSNRVELGLKAMLTTESTGSNMTLENHLVLKDDRPLKMANHFTSMDDSISDTSLDLQLKPFSLPNLSNISAEHNITRDAPFLSLGMNPMPSTLSLPSAAGGTVKSEPADNDLVNAGKIQQGGLNSPGMKHVKSEPCEDQEISKVTIPVEMNAPCNIVLKEVLLGNQSQGQGSSFPMGQKCHSLDSPNVCDNMASDVASKSMALSSVLHPCTSMPNINTPNDSSGLVGKTQGLVNRESISGEDKCLPDGSSDKTSIPGDGLCISTESALESKPMISNGNIMNSFLVARETSNLPVSLLSDSLTCNGDGHASLDGVLEHAIQMDDLNGHHSSDESLTHEVVEKHCENMKVVESGGGADKDGALSEVPEESNSTCKSESDSSHVVPGATNIVLKPSGKDEDLEDGEVGNLALNCTVEDSSREIEDLGLKAVGTVFPSDVSVLAPSFVDEKATKLATSKEADALSSKGSDDGLLENKVESSSSLASALTTDSGKKGSNRTIRRTPKDQLKKDKGQETKIKSTDLGRKISQSSAASSQQQNAERPSLVKKAVPSETEHSEKTGAKKDASDRGDNKRIIYLNSTFNSSTSERRKSQEGRETPADRSFSRERRGRSRDDSYNERSRKVETDRLYGHLGEKSRPDFVRNRSRNDRLNVLHGDRNSNPDHLLEQINSSNGIRYARLARGAEIARGASPDSSKMLTRKPANGEMQNQTRQPCQRRSPVGRGRNPLGRHPMSDISPSRCIERGVPDFVFQAHEETLSRNMHELPYPHSQYERGEGMLLHRERRSLSPQMRRVPPSCSKSSPRSHQRSTRHWSPQARTSNGFNGQRELGRCRSPPPTRINRMQSSHERHCFQEEIIVRRHGSPPYLTQLPDDREHDFPRLVRGSSRNTRRFNMIDPRDMMEEEYFQNPEFDDVDDGFDDDRRGNERRGPIRSFRQRCVTGNNESEGFQYRVEDGPPPRALRLRGDGNEGFHEGNGGPRDFNVRFRNRLGNPSSRSRGAAQEQEDNYRHHGEQEWHETTAFDDGRTKRRRF